MPVMVRSNKKATKIWKGIMGIPVNMAQDKSAFSKEIQRKLNHQNTARVR